VAGKQAVEQMAVGQGTHQFSPLFTIGLKKTGASIISTFFG
jgi:hypothetical protein